MSSHPTDAQEHLIWLRAYLVDWHGRKAGLVDRGIGPVELHRRVHEALRDHAEHLYAGLVDEVEGKAAPSAAYAPLPEDVTILGVLAEAGVALSIRQIHGQVGGWCRANRTREFRPPIPGERAIKNRIPALLAAGLIARPQGRKTRTVAITPDGRREYRAVRK